MWHCKMQNVYQVLFGVSHFIIGKTSILREKEVEHIW